WGSRTDPQNAVHGRDGALVRYRCQKGGAGSSSRPRLLLPGQVEQWAPSPATGPPRLGMSWFTPAVREALGDRVVTEHKLKFFEHGATPNLVVKGIQAENPEQFSEIVEMLSSQHDGVRNAYKTLYLSAGADATVVGSN